MRFHKFQALGNDFLIVRESDLRRQSEDYNGFARLICDRHFGAGADGLELIVDHPANRITGGAADFEIRLFNADGGETPISGNGTRCVGAWLYLVEGWEGETVSIATGAGIKRLRPVDRGSKRVLFETDMGRPKFNSSEIPLRLQEPLDRVVGQKLDVDGSEIEFTAISMGNPHCSIFVDEFEKLDWRKIGARIEVHPAFPDRTNVEFVRVVDRGLIEVRFWERGCGETLASGTGACGAALAAMLNEFTDRTVRVSTGAGELIVDWRPDGKVIQTGEAALVYQGEWPERTEG